MTLKLIFSQKLRWFLGLGILTLIVEAMFLRQEIQSWQMLRQALAQAAQGRENQRDIQKETENLAQLFQGVLPEDVRKLQSLLFQADQEPQLLQLFERMALAAKVTLTNLELNERSKAGAGNGFSLALNLAGGGYRGLQEFLKRLVLTVPLTEIESLSFDPQDGKSTLNLYLPARPVGLLSDKQETLTRPFVAKFFADPRFAALAPPPEEPTPPAAGRENPFAPF